MFLDDVIFVTYDIIDFLSVCRKFGKDLKQPLNMAQVRQMLESEPDSPPPPGHYRVLKSTS